MMPTFLSTSPWLLTRFALWSASLNSWPFASAQDRTSRRRRQHVQRTYSQIYPLPFQISPSFSLGNFMIEYSFFAYLLFPTPPVRQELLRFLTWGLQRRFCLLESSVRLWELPPLVQSRTGSKDTGILALPRDLAPPCSWSCGSPQARPPSIYCRWFAADLQCPRDRRCPSRQRARRWHLCPTLSCYLCETWHLGSLRCWELCFWARRTAIGKCPMSACVSKSYFRWLIWSPKHLQTSWWFSLHCPEYRSIDPSLVLPPPKLLSSKCP